MDLSYLQRLTEILKLKNPKVKYTLWNLKFSLKGFGFVRFNSLSEAEEAVKKLKKIGRLPDSNIPLTIKWADGE